MTSTLTAPAVTLRPYQVECLERINRAAARGCRRQLVVAATGLGKTVIFCALARAMGVRTLILAHRDELIEQAAAKVLEVWPGADVGVVKGDRDEHLAMVVVASVQTLSRPSRMARLTRGNLLGPFVPFGLIVVDEAHHATAASYRSILSAFDAGADDGPLLLGVTATPDRGDGKGLDDLFDEVTASYDIRWGIARDYLSDLRGLKVTLSGSLDDVKVRGKDYDAGASGQWLEDSDAPAVIARAWLAHARGRRTLVFTPTVATAKAVAAEMVQRGVRAGSVDGTMPMIERRATLAAYAAGDIDVLANCAVLTEGYDEPRTDCIVLARPTKSRALYAQMVGRGTRRHPDKGDCLVIDVVGSTDVHDLVTVPSLFGIENPAEAYGGERTLTEVLHDQIERHQVQGRLLVAEAELFDKVRSSGRMAWVKASRPGEPTRYHLGLGRAGLVVMVQLAGGEWRAGHLLDNVKRVLIDTPTLETAQGVAEDFARASGGGVLADTAAGWRRQRPSAKQRDIAVRLGLAVPVGATKGDVSDMLNEAFALKRRPSGADL